MLVIVAHAGHDERAAGAGGQAERRDQVRGRAGTSAEAGEGRVYDEHAVAARPRGRSVRLRAVPRAPCGFRHSLYIAPGSGSCACISSPSIAAVHRSRARSSIRTGEPPACSMSMWRMLDATGLRRGRRESSTAAALAAAASRGPEAIAHRIVHGGERFLQATRIDDDSARRNRAAESPGTAAQSAGAGGRPAGAQRFTRRCRTSRYSIPRSTRRCRPTRGNTHCPRDLRERSASAAMASTASATRT